MKALIISILLIFTLPTFAEFELRSESTFESELKNRFHFSYGMKPSLGSSQDVNAITLSYGREWDKDFWLNGHFQSVGIKFRDLAQNNPSATNATDFDLEDQSEKLNILGAGFLYRSYYVAELLPFNLYELTGASITYSTFKEKVGGESFKGPGIRAMYAVMKPIGDYTHIGVHFDYNLGSLKRDANDDNETSSQRSLTTSWMSFGFDISFFL